ncbi:MAG: carbohydrate kinase family protein [Candidatus Hodarchaeota archaeon]
MILAIGNINLDWICTLPHLPAPDEKVNIKKLDIFPGGAASNFAVSLARLGSEVAVFGHIGNDAEGLEALQALNNEHVDTVRIIREKNLATGFVIILIGDKGQSMKLRYHGANARLSPNDITPALLEDIEIAYAASVSIPLAEKLAKTCSNAGIRSAIDVGEDLIAQSIKAVRKMICRYSIVFMNELVFERIFEEKPTIDNVQSEISQQLEVLNVTLGDRGSITATNDTVFSTSAFKVKAIDTTGAGDAFAAGFIHFYHKQLSLKEAAKRATACAAIQIMQLGARDGLPTTREVEEFIKSVKSNTM